MSLYTSLTGLAAATKDMAVISNNLANTQTTGFKRSSAKFEDVFASMPGTKASTATGVGTAVASVDQEFSQGDLENSSNVLDLAIAGNGFFGLLLNDGSQGFTRNGGFMLDKNNVIVNAEGYQLLGRSVNAATEKTTGDLGSIIIPKSIASTTAETARVKFTALTANQTLVLGGVTITAGADGATADEVAAAFANIAADGAGSAAGATIASTAGTLTGWSTGPVSNSSVTFTSTTTGDVTDLANTGTGTVGITSSPANHEFIGLSVDTDGMISARYGDGTIVKTAQIQLAKFENTDGLEFAAGSTYRATNEAGELTFASGGEPGYGTIRSSSIERANVDITTELVDLIKAQRNFQANAKAIETSSALASTLINMRT
jgi:flagellar hook protein FlgE